MDGTWRRQDSARCGSALSTHENARYYRNGGVCSSISEDNAHLYLWVTNNFLEDGLSVMRAWGFSYKTMITWTKDGKIGLGQYFRGITEHCLFGVRGSVPYKTIEGKRAQGTTGFTAPRGAHSVKPEEMRHMIERVHEHIITELQQNARTDTIFILTAILLNLLTLGVNSAVASESNGATQWIVFITFIALALVVNFVVIIGLLRGKQTRIKLVNGLLKMYKDQGVEGYYDPSLLSNYSTRYNLFILAVVFTGVIALVVPLTLLLT